MAGCKNYLIVKYYSKFLVSNICHINFITYIKKSPLYTFWVRFPIKKYK